MNLQKLQVFLTLYETLNYTETAERLYISQGKNHGIRKRTRGAAI